LTSVRFFFTWWQASPSGKPDFLSRQHDCKIATWKFDAPRRAGSVRQPMRQSRSVKNE
jgi:hypothetical protein